MRCMNESHHDPIAPIKRSSVWMCIRSSTSEIYAEGAVTLLIGETAKEGGRTRYGFDHQKAFGRFERFGFHNMGVNMLTRRCRWYDMLRVLLHYYRPNRHHVRLPHCCRIIAVNPCIRGRCALRLNYCNAALYARTQIADIGEEKGKQTADRQWSHTEQTSLLRDYPWWTCYFEAHIMYACLHHVKMKKCCVKKLFMVT